MAESKYAKYLTTDILRPVKGGAKNLTSTRHLEPYAGGDFSLDCGFITEPILMIPAPHQHDFDQYICFFSASHEKMEDFDAVIEISLGEEGEKQVITRPTIVRIPAGVLHCPLNFKRVDKPVFFQAACMQGMFGGVYNGKELYYNGPGNCTHDETKKCDACRSCLDGDWDT